MNISSLELYSDASSEGLEISFRPDDVSSKYQVRSITGLDAPEIVPKFYAQSKAYVPGGAPGVPEPVAPRFYDLGLRPRIIALRATLNPNWENNEAYGDVRDELYKIIASSRTGTLSVNLKDEGTVVARVDGKVSKFEVDHFTKLPEVTLTIQCDDPMLRGPSPVQIYASDLYQGTAVSGTPQKILIPDGISTAPHGFTAVFDTTTDVGTPAPHITIQDDLTNPTWVFKSTPSGGFASGEIVYFSSEAANRYFYKVNFGTPTHLVDTISADSVWPIIFPGYNEFYILENGDTPLPRMGLVSVEFYPAFWGV